MEWTKGEFVRSRFKTLLTTLQYLRKHQLPGIPNFGKRTQAQVRTERPATTAQGRRAFLRQGFGPEDFLPCASLPDLWVGRLETDIGTVVREVTPEVAVHLPGQGDHVRFRNPTGLHGGPTLHDMRGSMVPSVRVDGSPEQHIPMLGGHPRLLVWRLLTHDGGFHSGRGVY